MTRAAICVCFLALAACESVIEPASPCEGLVRAGELHVVIGPPVGIFGVNESVFVGDTLALSAEVRPAIGAYVDVWGSGGCKTEYGAVVAATIVWSSEDVQVATVDAGGRVVGRREGTATITARSLTHNLSGNRSVAVWVRAGS
jgi:hypothetical protein